MPIYEYCCQDCGHRFDVRRPIADADKPVACQYCGEIHTHRAISTFFAHNRGTATKTSSSSCGSCSGGCCSSCKH